MSVESTPFTPAGKVIVVTGGASGIGKGLAERFAAEGAATVVVADLDEAACREVAGGLAAGTKGIGIGLDVTDEAAVTAAVQRIESEAGDIDLWCSNAGISRGRQLGTDDDWAASWNVHLLAHVYAARALVPGWLERGDGHLLITASAAGLLTNMDSAPYTVTKHAAVALAEWLAINHGDAGITVHCLCPQGVDTPMTRRPDSGMSATRAAGGFLQVTDVADTVLAALAENRFLVLPHPEVSEYERRRATDRDRWLSGMRRVLAKLRAQRG